MSRKLLSINNPNFDTLKYIVNYGTDVISENFWVHNPRISRYLLQIITYQLERDHAINTERISSKRSSFITQNRVTSTPAEQATNVVFSYYGLTNEHGNTPKSDLIDKYFQKYTDYVETPACSYTDMFVGTSDKNGIQSTFDSFCLERKVVSVDHKFKKIRCQKDIYSLLERDKKHPYDLDFLDRFARMLIFFSDFSLLSPFGYFLKQRISKEKHREIVVTNQSVFKGLSDESVFRCLKAIHEESEIRFAGINGGIVPLRVYYNHRRQPYLFGLQNHEPITLPLYKGNAIKICASSLDAILTQALYYGSDILVEGRKIKLSDYTRDSQNCDCILHCASGEEINLCSSQIGHVKLADEGMRIPVTEMKNGVPLKHHRIHVLIDPERNAFLFKRLDTNPFISFESTCCVDGKLNPVPNRVIEIDSLALGKMLCHDYSFDVITDDEDYFFDWVRSFGEFCFLDKDEIYPENRQKSFEAADEKVDIDYKDGIFNPYNSVSFNWKVSNNKKVLPSIPTNQEIYWLDYVLESYPNMTQCFLKESERNKLLAITHDYMTKTGDAFNPFKMLIGCGCDPVDIDDTLVTTLQDVLDIMKNQEILRYCWKGERKVIVPVILKYHAEFHHFTLAAYDVIEKRIIAIDLNKFGGKDYSEFNDDEKAISDMDCLYFLCAKLAIQIEEDSYAYVDDPIITWLKNSDIALVPPGASNSGNPMKFISRMGKSIFDCTVRDITIKRGKNIFETVDPSMPFYQYAYDVLHNVDAEWTEKSFKYCIDKMKSSEWDTAFRNRVENEFYHKIKTMALMAFLYLDDKNPATMDYVKQAKKDAYDLIINEFHKVYSRYMTNELKFAVKVPLNAEVIDRIQEVFADYNCTTFKDDEKDDYLFRLKYERFDVNKIMKGLMTLSDIITVTDPAEEKRIFDKRLKNKADVLKKYECYYH